MTAFNINYDTTPDWMKENRNNSSSRARKTIPKSNILGYIVPAAIGLAISALFFTLDEQNIKNKIATKQLQSKVSQTIKDFNHAITQRNEATNEKLLGLENKVQTNFHKLQSELEDTSEELAGLTQITQHYSDSLEIQAKQGFELTQLQSQQQAYNQALESIGQEINTTQEELDELKKITYSDKKKFGNQLIKITYNGGIAEKNRGGIDLTKGNKRSFFIASNPKETYKATLLEEGYKLVRLDGNCESLYYPKNNNTSTNNYLSNLENCITRLYDPKTKKYLPNTTITFNTINHSNK